MQRFLKHVCSLSASPSAEYRKAINIRAPVELQAFPLGMPKVELRRGHSQGVALAESDVGHEQCAEVVEWQTRTFEGRVAQAVRVQVPPSAPKFVTD